jgi:hypothetical protein
MEGKVRGKMPTFLISHEQSQACLNYAMARNSMKIFNKQLKILLNI